MSQNSGSVFLELPVELQEQITGFVREKVGLRSVCKTSRQCRTLAMPHLYHDLEIDVCCIDMRRLSTILTDSNPGLRHIRGLSFKAHADHHVYYKWPAGGPIRGNDLLMKNAEIIYNILRLIPIDSLDSIEFPYGWSSDPLIVSQLAERQRRLWPSQISREQDFFEATDLADILGISDDMIPFTHFDTRSSKRSAIPGRDFAATFDGCGHHEGTQIRAEHNRLVSFEMGCPSGEMSPYIFELIDVDLKHGCYLTEMRMRLDWNEESVLESLNGILRSFSGLRLLHIDVFLDDDQYWCPDISSHKSSLEALAIHNRNEITAGRKRGCADYEAMLRQLVCEDSVLSSISISVDVRRWHDSIKPLLRQMNRLTVFNFGLDVAGYMDPLIHPYIDFPNFGKDANIRQQLASDLFPILNEGSPPDRAIKVIGFGDFIPALTVTRLKLVNYLTPDVRSESYVYRSLEDGKGGRVRKASLIDIPICIQNDPVVRAELLKEIVSAPPDTPELHKSELEELYDHIKAYRGKDCGMRPLFETPTGGLEPVHGACRPGSIPLPPALRSLNRKVWQV